MTIKKVKSELSQSTYSCRTTNPSQFFKVQNPNLENLRENFSPKKELIVKKILAVAHFYNSFLSTQKKLFRLTFPKVTEYKSQSCQYFVFRKARTLCKSQ